jgi:probable rRNA maturation factor
VIIISVEVADMLRTRVSIQVERPYLGLVSREWLGKAARLALKYGGMTKPAELSLVITSDDQVHRLNREYRGVDRTTDVLAFALAEANDKIADPFAVPPDKIIHLGEVIISYPQAKRQAEERKHSIERELALLVAHGVLHLLGYDHEKPEDAKKMRALEAKVLADIGTRR